VDYDEAYGGTADFFGPDPDPILVRYLGRIDRGRPVLDVGTGQGRHAVYVARAGFTVDAVDPSRVAIETVRARAAEEGLPIRTHRCGFETFVPPVDAYSAALLLGLIQELRWESIRTLVERALLWSRPKALVFVTAFGTEDPSFADQAAGSKVIGKNSYLNQDGSVRTFLEPGEILRLFPACSVLHHWEGLGPEHRHGGSPPERHGRVEAIFQSPARSEDPAPP